jgi:predicted glycosyltransferase
MKKDKLINVIKKYPLEQHFIGKINGQLLYEKLKLTLEKIFDLFTIKNFEKNKIVFTKNSECKKINVIIEGSLVKVKNKK